MPDASVLQSILTIVGSGVVSATVTYKLNESKSERDFARGKLEELWTAVDTYAVDALLMFAPFTGLLGGEGTIETATQEFIAKGKEINKSAFNTMERLTHIYFTPLIPSFVDAKLRREKIADLIDGIIQAQEGGDLSTRLYSLKLEVGAFRGAVRRLKDGIASLAPGLKRGLTQRRSFKWSNFKKLPTAPPLPPSPRH